MTPSPPVSYTILNLFFQTMEYPLTRNVLQQMSRDDLREQCRKLNYRVTGFKSELAERVLTGDYRAKTKRSSPPVTKPKPVIVVSDDYEETMDYEEHTRQLRQLFKHVALPALDAHGTPIPIANPLNHT